MTNLDKFIAVMKRAAKNECLYMPGWQTKDGFIVHDEGSFLATTEAALHRCGNAACAGGNLAVSPEWMADGGTVGEYGQPVMGDLQHSAAVSCWLGKKDEDVRDILLGEVSYGFSHYYDKCFDDVTAEDVIEKLEGLR